MIEEYSKKDGAYFSHTRPELLPFLDDKMDVVLDVGCAGGNFGQMLKNLYGSVVWGIEPDRSSAEQAAKKLDHVINGSFDEQTIIPAEQRFDWVFFNDVLEHLAEPGKALMLAKQMLKEDGRILASIPSIRFYPVILSLLRYRDFKYVNAGVMDKTHLRFFTHKSMLRLFEEAGLKILKTEGINRCDDFRWFNVLNLLLLNTQSDMKYPQFVIVASK